MDPLEAIAKNLVAFGEKDLCLNLLKIFGEKAHNYYEYDTVAKILFDVKEYEKSLKYAEKALKNAKNYDERSATSVNLVNLYNRTNYPEKSLKLANELIKNNPSSEISFEMSVSYGMLGNLDKSKKILTKVLQDKTIPEELRQRANYNYGSFVIKDNNLVGGLELKIPLMESESYQKFSKPKCKKWDGQIKQGITIYVDGNCGCGDEVMHIRFLSDLKKLGMNPIWITPRKGLVNIFKNNGFNCVYIKDNIKYKDTDVWVYALALPYVLNKDVKELGRTPYLTPLPEKENKYSYIKKDKKIKLGIFWNSQSSYEQAKFRAVDFNNLIKVVDKEKFSLYSLQMDDVPVPKKYKNRIKEFHFKDRDFDDTFSIINQMDCIVTSCSATAHIAAAIGKKVFVLSPVLNYYSWNGENNKCWWYGDHVTILSQDKPRVWNNTLKKLEELLNEL